MTTQLETTSVTAQTEVDAPVEHAFRVFTEGIGSWWNKADRVRPGVAVRDRRVYGQLRPAAATAGRSCASWVCRYRAAPAT